MEPERARHHLETRLVHGDCLQPEGSRPTLPPLHLTTAFDFDSAERMEAVFAQQVADSYYTRMGNPPGEARAQPIPSTVEAPGHAALASARTAPTL